VVVVPGEHVVRAGPTAPVVVGDDGSHVSRAAVHHAAGAAQRAGAEFRVVLVAEDVSPLVYAVAPVPEVELGEYTAAVLHRRGEGLLHELREHHPGLSIQLRFRRGSPAKVLSQESHGAGLLVVGSRGTGRVRDLLRGSTSAALVISSAVPVAVVHDPQVTDGKR